jgi:hypothetical protein
LREAAVFEELVFVPDLVVLAGAFLGAALLFEAVLVATFFLTDFLTDFVFFAAVFTRRRLLFLGFLLFIGAVYTVSSTVAKLRQPALFPRPVWFRSGSRGPRKSSLGRELE